MDAGGGQGALQGGQAVREFRPRISPDISSELLDLDPLLNAKWQVTVSAAFKRLSGDERKYAYYRYLAPKGIRIDAENKRLTFAGRPSLAEIKLKLGSSKLIAIANKLEAVLATLSDLRDAIPYVDLLEASLSLINDFHSEEDLQQIRLKRALRQAFLDELVMLTRSAPMVVPTTHRGLSSGAVRDFVIEVYLKQQMLGYRFRVRPAEELKSHANAFIRDEIAGEACIRQCEFVSCERYLFLIGPVRSFSLNPYSARRFLYEDVLLNGSAVFFNGMAIPFVSLEKDEILKHLSWSLSRVVTVERQVSAGVMAIMDAAHKTRVELLLPLLAEDIAADGAGYGMAVAGKLKVFEELLVNNVLVKLPQALRVFARTNDDHDYLFFNLHAYFLQLAADVRDFSGRSSLVLSDSVEELELCILSYLRLLEKRRDKVFSLSLREDPVALDDAKLPLQEFRGLVKGFVPKARQLALKRQQMQEVLLAPSGGVGRFLDNTFNRTERRGLELERLERDLALQKKQCLVGLIRICKRYPELTVYLELEGLVVADEALRRYALPAGQDGLGQLPRLVTLWEDQLAFDFEVIAERLGVVVSM